MAKQKLDPDAATLRILRVLGRMHATREEAAAELGVSRPTLWKFLEKYPEALEAFEMGQGHGKIALRRIQWKLAKTNTAMAIFLGKQLLGQRDQYALEHGGRMEINQNTVREDIERKLARISEAKREDDLASEPIQG